MNLSELINAANELSDEQEIPSVVSEFVNDAIAKINVECDANFPFLNLDSSSEEPAFPEKWQRMLIIPYVVGRIKQRDSSQFEYTDSYDQFLTNLDTFQSKYDIPDEYLDDPEGMSGEESDIYLNPPWYYGGF